MRAIRKTAKATGMVATALHLRNAMTRTTATTAWRRALTRACTGSCIRTSLPERRPVQGSCSILGGEVNAVSERELDDLLSRGAALLKSEGAREVYVFGSVA